MEIKLEGELLQFEYGEKIEDPLLQLLKKHGIDESYNDFKGAGIDSVDKFNKISNEKVSHLKKLVSSGKEEAVGMVINSYTNDLVSGYVDCKLIVHHKNRNMTYVRDWTDFSIGNSENSRINILYEDESENTQVTLYNYFFDIIISYQQGKYWLVNNVYTPVQELFVRVGSQGNELRADDIIKMGNLELRVCRFNVGKSESKGSQNLFMEKSIVI